MAHEVKLLTPEERDLPVADLPVYLNQNYPFKPFDDRIVSFFDVLSKNILSDSDLNRLPEMVALGFWLRKSSIATIKSDNESFLNGKSYLVNPIGRVFHVCPANVDTMFIYSMTVSVLMGNKNILRVSSRMNELHIKRLFAILNKILKSNDYKVLGEYINIISYSHHDETSTFLSQHCNARVIWGGDSTIGKFRLLQTAPRVKDILFADRISMLIVRCASYLALDEKGKDNFAKLFFNDAYTFDQMGCSSPQTIYFLGDRSEYQHCKEVMLDHLSKVIEPNYHTEISSLASLKLNRMVDDVIDHVITTREGNNYVTFMELRSGSADSLRHGCGGGYFYVRQVDALTDLQLLRNNKVQTIGHFGLTADDKEGMRELSQGEGIDRIVPLGQALNFHYIWDGYNLIEELSRKCFVKF